MPAALLDTNAISDLMGFHPKVHARTATYPDPVLSSVVVLGEIRHGLDRLPAGKKRLGLESRAKRILAKVTIEPITESIAAVYGALKASLESQGLNLGDNDLWIAASASALGS